MMKRMFLALIPVVCIMPSMAVSVAEARVSPGQDSSVGLVVPPKPPALIAYTASASVLDMTAAQDSPVPYIVARVVKPGAPVYASVEDGEGGATPKRYLDPFGYLWVSVIRAVKGTNHAYYQINAGEYVRADVLAVYSPSTFHGSQLAETPSTPLAFIVQSVQPSNGPGGAANPDAPVLKRYTLLPVLETKHVGNWDWYRVGDQQWIKQTTVGLVTASPRPAGVGPTDKWVEVNLFEQTLAAYEGDRMVFTTLVSSGLPQWPTNKGLFRIWIKMRQTKMSGREGLPDYYYLEDVPWVMYFDHAIALHGAYWHDGFGYRHSHGCVNLSPADAKWLYYWTTPVVPDSQSYGRPTEADPGTWVWVH